MSSRPLPPAGIDGESLDVLRYAFGRAAHDLNNYLSGLLGYLALLKSGLSDEPEYARYCGLMDKSGGNMAALVSAFADFAEPGIADASPADVNAVVRSAVKHAVVAAGLDLTLELDEAAPRVVAHSGSLREAVAQVLRNALEASSERPAAVTIRTASAPLPAEWLVPPGEKAGQWVRIEVTDHGAGMDEATVRSCVVPFFTTKRATDQHGLGLALVCSGLHAWGGGLDVQSKPGAGTTVSLYLRAAEPR